MFEAKELGISGAVSGFGNIYVCIMGGVEDENKVEL